MSLKGKIEVCKQDALDTLEERWKASVPQPKYDVVGVRRKLRKVVSYEIKESIEVSVISRTDKHATLITRLYDAKTLRSTNENHCEIANDVNEKPFYP